MTDIDERLIKKERQFRDFQIWPFASRLDIRRWLTNFTAPERAMAMRIATRFMHFSESPTDALFRASLQRLLNNWRGSFDTFDEVAFVVVEGEVPNATDSGNLFARKVRSIGIAQEHILRPQQALEQAANYRGFVFVDDFVGSGNQMLETWDRPYEVGTLWKSFYELAGQSTPQSWEFAYSTCICTSSGLANLATDAPELSVSAAHIIGEEANLSSLESKLWTASELPDVHRFLEETGKRAGYAANDGGEEDWLGFDQLALGLSFSHGTPDATLPVFRSVRNGWQPLIGAAGASL